MGSLDFAKILEIPLDSENIYIHACANLRCPLCCQPFPSFVVGYKHYEALSHRKEQWKGKKL